MTVPQRTDHGGQEVGHRDWCCPGTGVDRMYTSRAKALAEARRHNIRHGNDRNHVLVFENFE
ncbi:unnamed protein product [Penicillium olsonii]|nr:unnamed protein product [Penicillium olsonii]CAG7931171.1 unnamed protein product [Penicillium olsonii]